MSHIIIINSCYNPPKGWAADYVIRADVYAKALSPHTCEWIIVNDGSSDLEDKDIDFIKHKISQVTYVSYPINLGKGGAIRKGVSLASDGIIIYTDIDFPYTSQSLLDMIALYEKGNVDMVLGRRDNSYFNAIPLSRKVISKALIWANKYILGLSHPDTQCGLKVLGEPARQVFLEGKVDGFLFEIELVKALVKRGYKVDSVNVQLESNVIVSNVNVRRILTLIREYLNI